jgi:hypothetical protein
MKTTSKKTKIIGKETYVNQRTGEIEEHQVIQMTNTDFNFDKIWLGHILETLDMIGNQKIKVLNYFLDKKDSKNLVIATQRSMAKEINVSTWTINKTIKALKESDFITQVQRGVYRINPDKLFKGGKSSRMNVLLKYEKEKNNNEKDK